MQSLSLRTTEQAQRWNFGGAFERPLGPGRGMLLSNVTNVDVIVERLLSTSPLDCAICDQLARILSVTAREWVRK